MLQGCLDEFYKFLLQKCRPELYVVLRHLILWARPMYFRNSDFRGFLEDVLMEDGPSRVTFLAH